MIKLIRESEEKDNKIKQLESDKKKTDKRLKRLEEGFKRLSRLLSDSDKKSRVLKEKSTSLENEINSVKNVLRKK